jgi:hypothetical protein
MAMEEEESMTGEAMPLETEMSLQPEQGRSRLDKTNNRIVRTVSDCQRRVCEKCR